MKIRNSDFPWQIRQNFDNRLWFAGESLVVGHENLKNIFWTVADDKPCYEYSVDVLERQDPAALPLMPSKEDYIVNYPQITYSDRMTLKVGDTDFFLYYTPGHSDAQSCVHVPKERVAFVVIPSFPAARPDCIPPTLTLC